MNPYFIEVFIIILADSYKFIASSFVDELL